MNDIKPGKTYINNAENVVLTVSDDNIAAYLTFKDAPGFIDENEILKLLKQANVSHGYSEALKYNLRNKIKKEPGKPFLVALGSNPNAKPEITLLFDRTRTFNPDVSFNVFEMDQFVTIERGQPLAEVSVALSSQAGKDIFGNEINKFSKEEPTIYNYIGKDIRFDEDTNQLIAMKSGYPYIDNTNRIQIKSDFYINEDLENVDLNLHGDLVINGFVFNSNLNICGDLMIYGEIEDCMDYGIFATGDITMDYAYDSRIVSGGQIKFHNDVENCLLSASEGIWGDEKSNVVGGLIQSANSIVLYSVGSEKPVVTEIEICLATYTKELLKRTEAKLNNIFEKSSSKQSKDNEEKENYSKQLIELEEKYIQEVEAALKEPPKRFKISVVKQVYPEVLIRILNHSHTVKNEKGKMTFTFVDNEIVINEVDKFI